MRGENKKGRNLIEIGQMESQMFGTNAKPSCNLKAGETNAFLEFLLFLLSDRFAELGAGIGKPIYDAGIHLFRILEIIRTSRVKRMPPAMIQQFHFHTKGYLTLVPVLGMHYKPKDHMIMEMSLRLARLGSPKLYGCWTDESLNRLLRDVAGGAHSTVHERRVLAEFPKAHDNLRAGKTVTKRQCR